MKKQILILMLLSFYLFFFSCTSPEKKFKEAETANTIESFQIFLNEFPESKFSILAKNKIDSLAYENALKQNTENSFFQYTKSYPDSKYAEESLSMAASMAYERVLNEDKESTYLEFVRKYPHSEFAKKAKNQAAKLRFEKVLKEYTLEGFQKFVSDYPESESINPANIFIEDIKNGLRYWSDKEFEVKIRDIRKKDFEAAKQSKFTYKLFWGIEGRSSTMIFPRTGPKRIPSFPLFDIGENDKIEVESAHIEVILKEGLDSYGGTGIAELFFEGRSLRVYFFDDDTSAKLQQELKEMHSSKYKKHIKNRRGAPFSMLCTSTTAN